MKTTKTFKLLSLGLFLMIFLINIVNAQTLVAGKVYDSGYDNIVSGADITVTCNSNSLTALTTKSLGDGTYAVRFDVELCPIDSIVNVNGAKGDLSGSDSGVVIECNDQDNCAEGYVSIINLAIKSSQGTGNNNGGGGEGRHYYYCGNNYCDTGETATTCPRDCEANVTTNTTASQGTVALTILENQEQNASETDNETQNQGGLITGAVIGAEGNSGLLVIIVFLAILLASLIAVRFMRNREAITKRLV